MIEICLAHVKIQRVDYSTHGSTVGEASFQEICFWLWKTQFQIITP